VGFSRSISATFFSRRQRFNCFSRLIAVRTSTKLEVHQATHSVIRRKTTEIAAAMLSNALS